MPEKKTIITKSGPGVFEAADYYEVPGAVSIYSWCPTPDASGKPTQVHLHIGEAPPGAQG